VVQALVVCAVSLLLLGLDVAGPTALVVLVALLDALVGTALGLFVSAFARTEFQAMQFMPLVVIPQLFLCGLVVPVDQLPPVLEQVAWVLPLTYGYRAMTLVASKARPGADFWADVAGVIPTLHPANVDDRRVITMEWINEGLDSLVPGRHRHHCDPPRRHQRHAIGSLGRRRHAQRDVRRVASNRLPGQVHRLPALPRDLHRILTTHRRRAALTRSAPSRAQSRPSLHVAVSEAECRFFRLS
jgi:hypothetical protein